MTEEDKEGYKNNKVCLFHENKIECDKVRDHCHLSGRCRGPANNKCNINVTQKQSNFIPFPVRNFIYYDCHMFF